MTISVLKMYHYSDSIIVEAATGTEQNGDSTTEASEDVDSAEALQGLLKIIPIIEPVLRSSKADDNEFNVALENGNSLDLNMPNKLIDSVSSLTSTVFVTKTAEMKTFTVSGCMPADFATSICA